MATLPPPIPAENGLSGGPPQPQQDQAQAPVVSGPATEGPANPGQSIAEHILSALGGGGGDPMHWAKGVLAGSLAGAANVGKQPEGAGWLHGASQAAQGVVEQRRQQAIDLQKQAEVQQEMKLKQAADARAEKELQIHMEDTKVQRAMWTAQIAGMTQAQNQAAEKFEEWKKEAPIDFAEKKRQFDVEQEKIDEAHGEMIGLIESVTGKKMSEWPLVTNSADLTPDHAKQAASGDIFPVHNGESHAAGEDGVGVHIIPGQYWDQPITKPFTMKGPDGKEFTASPGTTLGTLAGIISGKMKAAQDKQTLVMQQLDQQAKQAQIRHENAETAKENEDIRVSKLYNPEAAPGTATAQNVDPKTGADEQYLSSLSPAIAAEVKAIGEGRVEVNSRMFQSKQGQQLAAALTRAYPGFDQSKAQSYFKMRQDFTSGKTGQAINSYNTGIAHLGTMWDHVANASTLDINNPWSTVHRQLDLDKQLVSTELAKAVSNGSMTEGEKDGIMKSISGATPNSYRTRIREAVELLHGKQEAYQQQWNNGAPPGAVSQVPIISPQADQTIAKINGQQQQQPQQQGHPHPVGEVREYMGGKYVFDGKQYVLQQGEEKK